MSTNAHGNAIVAMQETAESSLKIPVDRIRTYDHNPRRSENPEFLRIKASIRAQGLDQPLVVTQRPGDTDYMTYAGGNTRLRAIKELYAETGDAAFYHLPCLVKPWQCESDVLLAHLRENDLRADLTFIDRAQAVFDLKQLLEKELGTQALSQRQLQVLLKERGYSASPGLLSPMAYAVQTLLPVLPQALYGGLGRPQVDRIRQLERTVRTLWKARGLGDDAAFDAVFETLCRRYDGPDWDLDLLRGALETEMAEALEVNLHTIRLELDARLAAHPPSATKSQATVIEPEPTDTATDAAGPSPTGDRSHAARSISPPDTLVVDPIDELTAEVKPSIPRHPPQSQAEEDSPTVEPVAVGDKILRNDLASLRARASTLAAGLAERNGLGELIAPLTDQGLGFIARDVPDAALADQLDPDALSEISLLWWQLAACAEMTVAPLEAIVPLLAKDTVLRRALEHQDAGLLFNSVWTLDPGHTGYRLWRTLSEPDWQDLVELMTTYRRIHRIAADTHTPLWEG